MGAHQKIDRVARNHLKKILEDNSVFPTSRKILQFEGKNGPDGIKRKSPAKDEPWHYFDPYDDDDKQLLHLIDGHYKSLVQELRRGNTERSAFEAAWLAHALIDGLTPAHHYPYEEKLMELMGGQGIETRTTVWKKSIMPGETRSKRLKNNWAMWGPRGLLMGHFLFEVGISTLIAPLTFSEAVPSTHERRQFKDEGLEAWYIRTAREIAALNMYEAYQQKGWTPKLAWQVRHTLGPLIVKTVTLAWYTAAKDAKLT